MKLGDKAYGFRWSQQGYETEVTSTTRFATLAEVELLCRKINASWDSQLAQWPVEYEARPCPAGGLKWVEVRDLRASMGFAGQRRRKKPMEVEVA